MYHLPTSKRTTIRKLIACSTGIIAAILLFSCVAVNRTIVAPPSVPGATFVGNDDCSFCHEDITKRFENATHFRLIAEGKNTTEIGCESCHGPGSVHSETGGAYHTIVNPKDSPETCFVCHLDKRAEFNLPYSHPVTEGNLSCSDCHDPHEGSAIMGGGTKPLSEEQTCFECHQAQRGPFVFEHEASREGCTVCHSPHGSVNAKMLKIRNANLCLQCHLQEQTTPGRVLIGGFSHDSLLSRGSCWSMGCHEAVHGSHVNSTLRF